MTVGGASHRASVTVRHGRGVTVGRASEPGPARAGGVRQSAGESRRADSEAGAAGPAPISRYPADSENSMISTSLSNRAPLTRTLPWTRTDRLASPPAGDATTQV